MTGLVLHLHVPGLLGPVPDDAARLLRVGEGGDALACLLSRGNRTQRTAPEPVRTRFLLFGHRPGHDATFPAAPLSLLGDGGSPGNDWCFHADPVHLYPDRDRLLVLDPGRLAFPGDLVDELVGQFNALFREDGLELVTPHPDRWYLRVSHNPDLRTVPLDAALGHTLDDSLPSGDDARTWITHLNEMQMLLHNSALNRDRAASGYRTVNGIWPWGGGRLPDEVVQSPWSRIHTDNPLVRGLAMHSGQQPEPLPEVEDLLEASGADDRVLVDTDALPTVLDGETFQDWESALGAFAVEWAAPLLKALRGGRVKSVILDTGMRRWTVTPGNLRRFWRRWKPLHTWLERSGA